MWCSTFYFKRSQLRLQSAQPQNKLLGWRQTHQRERKHEQDIYNTHNRINMTLSHLKFITPSNLILRLLRVIQHCNECVSSNGQEYVLNVVRGTWKRPDFQPRQIVLAAWRNLE